MFDRILRCVALELPGLSAELTRVPVSTYMSVRSFPVYVFCASMHVNTQTRIPGEPAHLLATHFSPTMYEDNQCSDS